MISLTKTGILLFLTTAFSPENIVPIDIQKEVKSRNVEVFNREISFINEAGYSGVRLDARYGEGVVWLKHLEFAEGTIEFDARGKDVKQHSFVGIAFHGVDTTTYDVIYLRPFNFKAAEEPWKSRAIQYVSFPTYTWQVLREKFPLQYESSIQPAPDPNGWVHIRVTIKDSMISTFINGETKPSLVVQSLNKLKKGMVGLYVADTSGGDFANLKVSKAE